MPAVSNASFFNIDDHGNIAYRGNPPYVRGSETSKAAAEKIKPVTGKTRKLVYEGIAESAGIGATDLELQNALDMKGSTQRPRRCELYLSGHIKKKQHENGAFVTRDGCQVWVLRPDRGGWR